MNNVCREKEKFRQ